MPTVFCMYHNNDFVSRNSHVSTMVCFKINVGLLLASYCENGVSNIIIPAFSKYCPYM